MLLFISFTGKRKSWGGGGERKKKILWRCVSFVCALFFSDVRPIYEKEWKKSLERKKKTKKKKPVVGKMEKSSFCKYGKTQVVAFFMLWSAPQQVPAPLFFCFCFISFFLSLFFCFFPRGGKRGVGGVLRGDLSIGIVFIFIKTFLLSIELLQ